MKNKFNLLLHEIRLLAEDNEGQDLVEYALLAGFVAVAAGALLPGISDSISVIFSKMASVLSTAARLGAVNLMFLSDVAAALHAAAAALSRHHP